MALQPVPSPLDRPRFPDEPALSVWEVDGERVVGPVGTFGSRPVVHERGAVWPGSTTKTGPIGVQLVRGAPGKAGDEWSLVVDGVQCAYGPIEVDERVPEPDRPVDGMDTCVLPPPFAVREDELNEKTLVRPLALCVRLEEEALAPVKVEVIVQQIVYSGERTTSGSERGAAANADEARCRGEDPSAVSSSADSEIKELSRYVIKPHRTRDSVAPTLSMPYPVAAPAQSAIAIASYREVEKWKEKKYNNRRENDNRQEKYKEASAKYNDDFEKNREKAAKWKDDNPNKSFVDNPNVWKRKPPPQPKVLVDDDEPKDTERSFVIGGRDKTAAAAWKEIMTELLRVCCLTASNGKDDNGNKLPAEELWFRNKGATLLTHLTVMRKVLSASRSDKALAVLETLLIGDVSPIGAEQLRKKYKVDKDGQVILNPAEDAASGNTIASKYRTKLSTDNTSQFVWEYVPFHLRLNTHTRVRLVIEITEHGGGPPKRIALEPLRYDAYVAHVVYSEIPRQVRLALKATDKFRDCLFTLQREATTVTRIKEAVAALGRLKTTAYSWTLGWYRGELLPKKFNLDPAKVEPLLNEAKQVLATLIPDWPPPVNNRTAPAAEPAEVTEELRTTFDEAKENDAANVRKELEDAAFFSPGAEELDDVTDAEDAAPDAPATPQAGAPPEITAADMRLELRISNVQAEELTGNYFDLLAKYEERDGTPEPAVVEAPTKPAARPVVAMVVRELPQIVQPAADIYPNFTVPDDTAVPDNFYRPTAGTMQWIGEGIFFTASFVLQFAFINKFGRMAIEQYVKAGAWTTFVTGLWGSGTTLGGFVTYASSWAAGLSSFLAPYLAAGVPMIMGIALITAGAGALVSGAAQTVELKGRLYLFTTKTAYRNSVAIIQWNRGRQADYNARESLYRRAVNKARGVPITSSVAAAREAIKTLQKKLREELRDERRLVSVNVLYDRDTSKRFKFVELYALDEKVRATDLDKLSKVYAIQDWDIVPDSTSLSLLPPVDIVETLYESETLRGIPMDKAVQRTVGNADPDAATTTAEISARAAHRELVEFVRAGRYPFTGEVTGEDLLASIARVALQLSKDAAELLVAAYGKSAGVTLVYGDDSIWTCLPAGVAARIAVRHTSVFVRAEQARRESDDDKKAFRSTIDQWGAPQRALIEEFAKAFVAEAQTYARTYSRNTPPLPDLRSLGLEAARSFDRVRALSRSTEGTAMLTVTSACSTWLMQLDKPSKPTDQLLDGIRAEEGAKRFRYQPSSQSALRKPRLAEAGRWAPRRLDWEAVRNWRLKNKSSVNDLTTTLAGLSMDDGKVRTYYAPLGSRLDSLPGQVPFAVLSLGNHIISLRALSECCRRIAAVTRKEALGSVAGASLSAAYVAPFTGKNNGRTGLARHPLSITSQNGNVNISLATPLPVFASYAIADKEAIDIFTAFRLLVTDSFASEAVQKNMTNMRITAFNADRFLNALDLVSAQASPSTTIVVKLPAEHVVGTIVSLALGLAMHTTESQGISNTLSVPVPTTDAANSSFRALEDLAERCDAAQKLGCNVVSLAEVCAVIG